MGNGPSADAGAHDAEADQVRLPYDALVKIVMAGPERSGKSALLLRFTDDRWSGERYDPTIGVEFGSRTIEVPPEYVEPPQGDSTEGNTDKPRKIKMQIWDTAGQRSFRSITRSYYRGSNGLILVYDPTSREHFDELRELYEDATKAVEEDEGPVEGGKLKAILVAAKNDLTPDDAEGNDFVSPIEGAALASELDIPFIETSAKLGENVDEAFKLMLAQIFDVTPVLVKSALKT
jgi:small GTP-binding protein